MLVSFYHLLVYGLGIIVWLLGLMAIQAPALLWMISLATILFTLQWVNLISSCQASFLWLGIALITFIFCIKPIRYQLINPILIKWFRKVLPALSKTEQEAIEAGDTWFEAELIKGNPNWSLLMDLPSVNLSTEELNFLNNQTENLCEMMDDWEMTHKKLDLSAECWDYLKKEKFFGILIPKSYGGLQFSHLACSNIVQKIATKSLSAAVTVMVPNSLGPSELLLKYGTIAQKNYYLPRLAIGLEIPCFALTSPEAGSDAGAISDTGIITKGLHEGREILGISLTWNKRYITLAPVATLIGLAFKLYDPEGLLGDKPNLGITLALIPASHPNVEIGKRHFPLNQSFMNGPIRGKDVFIPLDWIIGGETSIGHGWKMLVECLSSGRGISLPALSTAAGKLSYRATGAYARIRQQFNTPIGHFEGVEASLAEIAGFTYILEATRLLTVNIIDNEFKPSVITGIAKYHMTEMARIVINDAMDIHGGRGIMLGPRNYLARGYQGIPISITVEGANILTRNLMIFGQGVMRAHPFIPEELKALNLSGKEALEAFDRVFYSHLKDSLSSVVQLIFHHLVKGGFRRLKIQIKPLLKPYINKMNKMSLILRVASDLALMYLGGDLKRRERLSARLGDVLSYLYLASSVLKYYETKGEAIDEAYAIWGLNYCLHKANQALNDFVNNFPNRFIKFILKQILCLNLDTYLKSSDALEHRLVKTMMLPSSFRDKLTQYTFVGKNNNDPLYRLEKAFEKLITIEPLLMFINQNIKKGVLPKTKDFILKSEQALKKDLITEAEFNNLVEFHELYLDVIQVDEFFVDELKREAK
ncbi:MAG: fadE [Francisellaceae bacterium]|nr:fadE [Francisellaceae bacterium]